MHNEVDLYDVAAYTDDDAIATVLAEHPEVRVLWERRDNIDGPVVINGIQPVMHVVFEAIAENQIQQGNPPEAGEIFERLMENRSHIAEYLKEHGDIEGALACLQENLSRAEEENVKEGSMEELVENAL